MLNSTERLGQGALSGIKPLGTLILDPSWEWKFWMFLSGKYKWRALGIHHMQINSTKSFLMGLNPVQNPDWG